MYAAAGQPEMCISPVAELLAPAHIFVRNIEAAQITDAAVYDNQFPVITVIKLHGEIFKLGREEKGIFSAGLFKILQHAGIYLTPSEGIHQQANFHTFLGFFREQIYKGTAHSVVFDDEVHYIN